MKSFKPIDWMIQATMIVTFVFWGLFFKRLGDWFLLAYFVVGGWQLISVLIHALSPAAYQIPARKTYLWLLLLTVMSTLVVTGMEWTGVSDFLVMWLIGILFWTPVLAIFYLVICIIETQKMKKGTLPAADETPSPGEEQQ